MIKLISVICLFSTPILGVENESFVTSEEIDTYLPQMRILKKVNDSIFPDKKFVLLSNDSNVMLPISSAISWQDLYCFILVCNLYYIAYQRNDENIEELFQYMDINSIKKVFSFFYEITISSQEKEDFSESCLEITDNGLEIQKLKVRTPTLPNEPKQPCFKIILNKNNNFSPFFIINSLYIHYGYDNKDGCFQKFSHHFIRSIETDLQLIFSSYIPHRFYGEAF